MNKFCAALLFLCAIIGPASAEETLEIGNATIHIDTAPDLPLPARDITEWVLRAAVAVTNYLGRYPVNTLYVRVEAGGDEPVSGGVTYGDSRINVRLGPDARPRDLIGDWIMTHEMFHLAFPTLDRRHLWMMEGLSDYLEPIARARVGQLSARGVWREFVEGLPQGLPTSNEGGLDNSPSRERIYWGGNLFWLLADIQIRIRTNNRRSVDDAIRAILNKGGDGGATWTIKQVIRAGDKATGTTVLAELYDELGLHPGSIHLDNLWTALGVVYNNGRVRFDDSAPWAAARAAITARSKPPAGR
ncbi:MAG TPA: hypothetical protein VGN61_00280 [Verrucomicrobiae bacterium]